MKKRICIFIISILLLAASKTYLYAETPDYKFEDVEPELIKEDERIKEEERERKEQEKREEEARIKAAADLKKGEIIEALKGNDYVLSVISIQPKNEQFGKIVGNPAGLYFGIKFGSIIETGIDYWKKDKLTAGDITELSTVGLNLTLNFPYAFNKYFIIYGGGGGRIESISIKSQGKAEKSLGNNAILSSVGGKLRFGSIGIEANYSQTFSAAFTDYNIIRIGVLWYVR